jgi:hypothetical protein
MFHRVEKPLDSGQFAKVIPAPQYVLGCLDRIVQSFPIDPVHLLDLIIRKLSTKEVQGPFKTGLLI